MKVTPAFRNIAIISGVICILLLILDQLMRIGHYGSTGTRQLIYIATETTHIIALLYLLALVTTIGESKMIKAAFILFIGFRLCYFIIHFAVTNAHTRSAVLVGVNSLAILGELYFVIMCFLIKYKKLAMPFIIYASALLVVLAFSLIATTFFTYFIRHYAQLFVVNRIVLLLGVLPLTAYLYIVYKSNVVFQPQDAAIQHQEEILSGYQDDPFTN